MSNIVIMTKVCYQGVVKNLLYTLRNKVTKLYLSSSLGWYPQASIFCTFSKYILPRNVYKMYL